MTAARPPLKDVLFNPENVAALGERLGAADPAFAVRAFVDDVVGRLGELELKQRIGWIAEALERHLPDDYRAAVDVLLRSLPEPCDPSLSDGDFGDFVYAPFSEYVARRGTAPADFDFSLAALREITTRFSAEDAIRAFLDADAERTLSTLLAWTGDRHYHVRRLASEGTRPRLPWSRRLTLPVSAGLPILDNLYADPTRYVTRSVANHLNDVAKTDPDLVVATLRRWAAEGRQSHDEMGFIIRHATRTLLRAGHRPTLELLGVDPEGRVDVVALEVSPTVELGGDLDLSVTLRAEEGAEAIVDYAVVFAGVDGRPGGRKAYRLGRLTLPPGEPVTLTRRHPMRAGMTTRPIRPGGHAVEVLANGVPLASRPFDVVPRGGPQKVATLASR